MPLATNCLLMRGSIPNDSVLKGHPQWRVNPLLPFSAIRLAKA